VDRLDTDDFDIKALARVCFTILGRRVVHRHETNLQGPLVRTLIVAEDVRVP
jgi:hypothetical protein